MELTDRHLEEIRKAARTVEYGSITINISATSRKLDLDVHNRIRLDEEDSVTRTQKNANRKV